MTHKSRRPDVGARLPAAALALVSLTLLLGFSHRARAEGLPTVAAAFVIESPEVFPDQVLGISKAEIETELSELLAERLEFFFPFFDWKAGEASSPNGLQVKITDRRNELCDWETLFSVRAVRGGNPIEMIDVPDEPLYDFCDPFLPNRKDPSRNALLAEDQEALVAKLKKYIENGTGDFGGLLNNVTIRQSIHENLLTTVPLASRFEIREQSDGSKLLYVPIDFDELKASIADEQCEGDAKKCTLLKLHLELPDSPPATLSLRIAGACNDQVLCEVMGGSVPGMQVSRTWWPEELEDLLARAQNLSFTMKEFTKSPFACATLDDTDLFVEP